MTNRSYSATERAAQAEADTLHAADSVATPNAPSDERLPDFPAECLPPVLEKMARAIADVCHVPLGMAAPMLLAVASASIGKGVQLKFARGNITTANLHVLVSKTSGSGGSVTFKHAVAPFVGIQKDLRRKFEETEKPRLDAEHADIVQQIEAAKRDLKGTTGKEHDSIIDRLTRCNEKLASLEKLLAGNLLFVTDVTSEKLTEMLAQNGEVMAHFDSDAADALGIIMGTRYGDGKHANDSLWLKGYTGEPAVIFRKNSPPVHLDSPCISVLFVATPDTVSELYRMKRLCAGGLLPRFVSCNPDARRVPLALEDFGEARSLPTEATQPYEAAIFAAVNNYRLAQDNEPSVIGVGPGFAEVCIADDEKACAGSQGNSDPFAARQMENAVRIALVLHVFRQVEIEQRGPGTYGARMHGHERNIDADTMRAALRIRDWFAAHQNKLREPERVAAEDSAWEKAQELMRDRPAQSGITARDLYTGHRVCGDAATAVRLLKQWCEEGRIVAFERKPEGAGRPTIAYRLATKGRM